VGMLNAITAQIESLELKAREVTTRSNSLRTDLARARNEYLVSAQNLKRQLNVLKRNQVQFDSLKLLDRVRDQIRPFVSEVELSQPIHANRREKLIEDLNNSILSRKIPLRVVGNTKHAPVVINGQPVEMILDTGASLLTLPSNLAARVGVSPKTGDPDIQLSVADGDIINAKMVTIETVQLGPFEVRNVRCAVLGPSESNAVALLGMSFLGNFEMKLLHDSVELTRINPTGMVESEK
jgi:aspartyl protease family protein